MNQQNRQFKCPCGKTYKSYPALHTHIRRKHDGEAPGELHLPHNKLPTRRGRPAVQMHKPQIEEKLQQLQALTIIELGIIKISQLIADHKTILSGNACCVMQFGNCHKYLFKEVASDKILRGIVDFLRDFCQHFTTQVNEIIIRAYSLLFWYLQKQNRGFDLLMITKFLRNGWKEISNHKGLEYDQENTKLIKQSLVVMTKWLYLKGLTQKILTNV